MGLKGRITKKIAHVHKPCQGYFEKSFPAAAVLHSDVNLQKIAEKYELSGSNIVNIVHYCCLQALDRNSNVITNENLLVGINREFVKENKMFDKS